MKSMKTSYIFAIFFFAFWTIGMTTGISAMACKKAPQKPAAKNFFCSIKLSIGGQSRTKPWTINRMYFERGVALAALGRIEDAKKDFRRAATSPAGERLAGIDKRLAEGIGITDEMRLLWLQANKARLREMGGPAFQTKP